MLVLNWFEEGCLKYNGYQFAKIPQNVKVLKSRMS